MWHLSGRAPLAVLEGLHGRKSKVGQVPCDVPLANKNNILLAWILNHFLPPLWWLFHRIAMALWKSTSESIARRCVCSRIFYARRAHLQESIWIRIYCIQCPSSDVFTSKVLEDLKPCRLSRSKERLMDSPHP
jgi:hypothetical protein